MFVVTPEIEEGIYFIVSPISRSNRFVIDCAEGSTEDGATLMLWYDLGATNQMIRVIEREDGFYELEFIHSKKLIDVAGGSMESKTKVIQWERNGRYNQHWKIVPTKEEGLYHIVARHSGMLLSSQYKNSNLLACTGDPKHFGAELVVYNDHGGSNQKWGFLKIK